MKTAEKNAKQVQGTNAKSTNAPRTENRPNITGKEAQKDEPAKTEKPAESPKVEATQTAEAKADFTPAVDNQPTHIEAEAPKPEIKAEEPKAEAQQEEHFIPETPKAEVRYIMPSRNVETTLKDVENLHRKGLQRGNLIKRKAQLEAFEVALKEEGDELNDNPFQGCKLIIEDDKKRQFVTTTPGLIRLTAQFIYEACDKKQAEIEADIVFPTA